MLEFDDYEFEKTAKVLVKINKSVTDNGYNEESLVSFMKSMAHQYLAEKNSTLSTYGFVLSSFTACDGNRMVIASLSAYMVEQYIKNVQEGLDKALMAVQKQIINIGDYHGC